jgi:branched-chain amino acid transport system permease protein
VLLQHIFNGVSLGMAYALIAIGYSIVFSVLKMMNFAHGDVYMFGTWICFALLDSFHVPVYVAVVAALAVGAITAAVVEFVAYRPLRKEEWIFSMITVLGAGYVLRNISEIIWGSRMRNFPSILPNVNFNILGATIALSNIVIIIVAIGILVAMHYFLQRSKHGQAVLAVSEDVATSSLMGVKVNRVSSLVYGLGGAIGVVGGILFSTNYNVINVGMAFTGTMIAYSAAIVGGFGSLPGAALGGLIIGLAQELFAGYVSTAYRDVVTYIILIVFLLARPAGILGRVEREKV